MLLLARNRINHIHPKLAASIPNLTTLVLTSNNLGELADLDPLGDLSSLTHLVLMENPITRKEVRYLFEGGLPLYLFSSDARIQHYRLWVIWRIPNVRFLDYRKVKDAERAQAKELFGTREEPTALASKIMGIKSRTFDVPSTTPGQLAPADKAIRVKLTDKERKKVEKMIREAKSLQEITRLERELNEGRIPGGAFDDDEDSEMKM